jgi:hypothetical protein
MQGLWDLSLLHAFDFYLMFAFVAGTSRRIDQYRHFAGIVFRLPGRWPRLLALVKAHRTIFLTWATALPALLALLLSVVQIFASRLVWPEAGRPPGGLTTARLVGHWPALLAAFPLGLAMVALDAYGILVAGQVNRAQLEKHFDQAEYWLTSRAATAVRVFTLGFVNPRRLVAVEVRKALTDASRLLSTTLWWVILQTALRIAFGLTLWLTWAATRGAG